MADKCCTSEHASPPISFLLSPPTLFLPSFLLFLLFYSQRPFYSSPFSFCFLPPLPLTCFFVFFFLILETGSCIAQVSLKFLPWLRGTLTLSPLASVCWHDRGEPRTHRLVYAEPSKEPWPWLCRASSLKAEPHLQLLCHERNSPLSAFVCLLIACYSENLKSCPLVV